MVIASALSFNLCTNLSFIDSSIIILEPAEHTSPWLKKIPIIAHSTAPSKSASAKITFGDLPPNSNPIFFKFPTDALAILCPTSVLPVNVIISTSLLSDNSWPTVPPEPKSKLQEPFGIPTSSNTSNDKNNQTNETSTTKYISASSGLNVRKGPSTSYSVISTLAKGTKVTVKSTSNGWSKITSGSITGYVNSSYLTSKKPSTTTSSNSSSSSTNSSTSTSNSASKVISYAKKLLGKPYVWGAQGPNGFDCSGFTYYVFKNSAGITLPRTSSAQSKYGKSVSKSNLKAGDLIFFDTVGPNNGAVTHVGLYIGNGQFIHAASGQGKVVINNLNSSYYVKAYVNARRVL